MIRTGAITTFRARHPPYENVFDCSQNHGLPQKHEQSDVEFVA